MSVGVGWSVALSVGVGRSVALSVGVGMAVALSVGVGMAVVAVETAKVGGTQRRRARSFSLVYHGTLV